MHPILFEIPGLGFPIRSFGVALAASFILGSYLLGLLARRYGDDPELDPERFSRVALAILIGVVLGARLMYVVVEIARGSPNGEAYLANPMSILYVWQGGLVMYGGLFGGIAFGVRSAKKQGLRIPGSLDLGLVAGFVGLAVGRVGCLLVGDDFGRKVAPEHEHLPFPIVVRVPEAVAERGTVLYEHSLFGIENAGQVLYATQTWMTINALILALIGFVMLSRRRYPGQVSLWLILLYAITRSFIEHFRGDSLRGLWFGDTLSTSQVISILTGLVALVLLWRCRGRGRTGDAAPS